MVAEKLPSPSRKLIVFFKFFKEEAQKSRIPYIWQPPVGINEEMKEKLKELENAMLNCDTSSNEVVVFVSKIFPLPKESFNGNFT